MPSGLGWVATPAFSGAVIQAAVPLYLLVLGALVCERAGLVNLGLEGMVLAGACVGAAMAPRLGPGPGIAFGVLAGVWLALLHALATIQFGVDQVVSGLALNVLAFGAARPLATSAFGATGISPRLEHLPAIAVPWLGALSPLVPLALLIGLAVLAALRFGVAGLRLDAAAAAPRIAEGAGLDTDRLRYASLAICGALAGLAGAGLSVELAGHYQAGITQGRGFLALAVCVLVGRSTLAGLVAATLLGALQAVPPFLLVGSGAVLLQAAPWLVVLVALALLGRRPRRAGTVPDRWRAGVTL
jgi:general nucleoside transport system permease protein